MYFIDYVLNLDTKNTFFYGCKNTKPNITEAYCSWTNDVGVIVVENYGGLVALWLP